MNKEKEYIYILLYFVSSDEQLLSGLHSNSITFQINPFSPSTNSAYTLQILLINIFSGNNLKMNTKYKLVTIYIFPNLVVMPLTLVPRNIY